jgi:hypothetical protein
MFESPSEGCINCSAGTAPGTGDAPTVVCKARGYGSVGCDCEFEKECAMSDDSSQKCCGTGEDYCGEEWSKEDKGSEWFDTCHDLDSIRITPGCSFERGWGAHQYNFGYFMIVN